MGGAGRVAGRLTDIWKQLNFTPAEWVFMLREIWIPCCALVITFGKVFWPHRNQICCWANWNFQPAAIIVVLNTIFFLIQSFSFSIFSKKLFLCCFGLFLPGMEQRYSFNFFFFLLNLGLTFLVDCIHFRWKGTRTERSWGGVHDVTLVSSLLPHALLALFILSAGALSLQPLSISPTALTGDIFSVNFPYFYSGCQQIFLFWEVSFC